MDEGWLDSSRFLEKICHIHGHLLNGGVVECLNVPQGSLVILSHHVDGYALSAKTTTATNPDRREKKLKFSSEQRLAYGAKRDMRRVFQYLCHTKMDGADLQFMALRSQLTQDSCVYHLMSIILNDNCVTAHHAIK